VSFIPLVLKFISDLFKTATYDGEATYPLDDIALSTVTDEELVQLLETSPRLYNGWAQKVVRLSKGLVLKGGDNTFKCEALNMKFISEHTSLHIPKVHRVFEAHPAGESYKCWYIVMDFIDGKSLDYSWASLNEPEKNRILAKVAEGMLEMRKHRSIMPGPIGGGRCQGRLFTSLEPGPFPNAEKFTAFYNEILKFSKKWNKTPKDTPDFKWDDFVMSHLDVTPRNLIVIGDPNTTDFKVYFIDWAHAGFFPAGFELVQTKFQIHFKDFNEALLKLFDSVQDKQDYNETMCMVGGLRICLSEWVRDNL
jgi:serine/threonine protein kinase